MLVGAVREPMLAALRERGAVLLDAAQKAALQALMWPDGKLSSAVIGQSARTDRARWPASTPSPTRSRACCWSRKTASAPTHPFSGEKLSPVLALYAARDFDAAMAIVERIYAFQGAGHSVGLHSARPEHALQLGLHAAGVARHRQPGALHRHRRQLRQRPAVLAVDGLRHLGRATTSPTT